MKIQKKNLRGWGSEVGSGGGRVGGVRVDVNEEFKFFLANSQKKIRVVGEGGGSGGGRVGGRSGWM